ncbi:uncharacterized protein BJ212DRAFT_1475700 [Suillus subaureus]|uniref:Uncharacterized protein n=1 Tax=Suillus subaureus TaxID=48587 RepID=A0A9P7EK33_9AGAM|nr:uncharacterized protein BJ212DRAFT_1475700 [Suillus subaureus]KAG1824392.1 hypothetical protein BJ212DRAFT_1475700 [Suillus subaureus]
MAIISGTRQIPLGNSHFSLTIQVSSLVAQVIKDYQTGPLPDIVLSCSKELLHVCGMTPQVWPNWHSIGYDNPHLLKHIWCPKLLAWEALGDHTFDLPVAAPPSTGLIPVDLPFPPIHTSNVTGPSTSTTTKFWDKGKGKAIDADPEPKVEGSQKRKSLMILALSSQLLKSVMKTCKHAKLSHWVKSKPLVDLEDEEDMSIQPFSGGVLDIILPQLSNSPRSPQVLTKKPFGPATVIASSHPAVIKPSQPTPESSVEAPPVIDGGDIPIPGPVKQPMPGLHQAKLALHNLVGQEDWESVYVMHLLHNKEDQNMRSRTPSKAPSKAPPASQSKAQTCTLLSLSSAVPAAALDLPMPDLHAMAIAILDGTACIAILKAHVAEQDGKINTLQHLHEGLRHKIIDQHPAFPIPEPLANAISLLLDQSVPPSMSPSASALPPLIDLSIGEIMPTPPKFKDASAIEGLLFEYNWVVQPEVPDTSGEIVDLGDPGNLVPEYDSSDDMDVEVKVEVSSEEVDMAT